MAPTLGKRKRVTREELAQHSRSSSISHSDGSEREDLQEVFRRAFEAKFKPINIEPILQKHAQEEAGAEDKDQESDSEWPGISSDEENGVEIVEYAGAQLGSDKASKAEMREFMSAKPPKLSDTTLQKRATKVSKPDDDPIEASHLKNDLELQSLLRESKLLSSHAPTFSTRTTAAPTRARLTDLHLQSLGAKGSIFAQKNMPMAHRKGSLLKKRKGEVRRRDEAKENGITLEKELKERKIVGKRERGIGGPSVGKFKGGTLTLSRKDVASITGSGGSGSRGKGKRRKR